MQMYRDVYRRIWMCMDVYRCIQMYTDVYRCICMYIDGCGSTLLMNVHPLGFIWQRCDRFIFVQLYTLKVSMKMDVSGTALVQNL